MRGLENKSIGWSERLACISLAACASIDLCSLEYDKNKDTGKDYVATF